MNEDLVRFSVSVDWQLLKEFDKIVEREGFENRSLIIRSLIKEYISSSTEIRKSGKSIFVALILIDDKFYCKGLSISFPANEKDSLHICIVDNYLKIKELTKNLKTNTHVKYFKVIPIETKE